MSEEEAKNNSGEIPVIPAPVVLRRNPSRFTELTMFFSWLTGLTLAISVLVALISVTSERNNLQTQLSCRANASFEVNKAVINEQIALADHSVLVGDFIIAVIRIEDDDPNRGEIFETLAADIEAIDIELDSIGEELRLAVIQQQAALSSC